MMNVQECYLKVYLPEFKPSANSLDAFKRLLQLIREEKIEISFRNS